MAAYWAAVGVYAGHIARVLKSETLPAGYEADISNIAEGYSMALYVKDAEVDRLAGRLAKIQRVSKAEAVRRALAHELQREEGAPSLVDRGMAFVRALHARGNPAKAAPADKDFIDSLYGDA